MNSWSRPDKSLIMEHVIRNPLGSASAAYISAETSPVGLLPDPASQQYDDHPFARESFKIRQSKGNSIIGRMNNFAQGLREHVRLGAKVTATVKGKLSLGARILQVGGVDKVLEQIFGVREGEKLLKASQCYLSTTAGPIAGLLFVSTDKVAFCSERLIKLPAPNGELIKIHYKVLIPINKIKRAQESTNLKRPSEKYIELVTKDGFEFWFMGFFNHKKSLKHLKQVISHIQ